MSEGIYYDDSRLMRMFEELDERARKKALRGAMAKAGRDLRKAARQNFRSSGIETSKDSEAGIRSVTYKRILGFRVTVGTKAKRADYSGMSASEAKSAKAKKRKAVIPLWMEGGTVDRYRTRRKSLLARLRSEGSRQGYTGALKALGFMEKTRSQELPRQESNIRQAIYEYVEKTARKYGASTD